MKKESHLLVATTRKKEAHPARKKLGHLIVTDLHENGETQRVTNHQLDSYANI